MSVIEKSIDLNVSVRTAYNQWTQFREFPRFMEAVEEVRQIDDNHLHWEACPPPGTPTMVLKIHSSMINDPI